MKRCCIYILMAVLSAVSCRKEPVVQLAPEEISFAAPAVAQTKSVLITDVEGMVSGGNERAYSVFASRYIPGPDGSITRHQQFMNDVKVYSRKTDDVWSPWQYDSDPQEGMQHFYWSPGAAYKFFAVYPYHNQNDDTYDLGISYSIDEAKHALKVTGKHDAGNSQKLIICTGHNGRELCPDILYGVRAFTEPYQVGENRDAVNFTMQHALSAVSFELRNASVYDITKIQTQFMTGFANASDHVWLSERGAEWATPDPDNPVEDKDGEYYHKFKVPDFNLDGKAGKIEPGHYYKKEGDYWCTMLMIPQNFGTYESSPSFTFTVTLDTDDTGDSTKDETKDYIINFQDYSVNSVAEHAYTYLPGYHYVYTFNVTAKNITCDVNIVPWVEDEYIELN